MDRLWTGCLHRTAGALSEPRIACVSRSGPTKKRETQAMMRKTLLSAPPSTERPTQATRVRYRVLAWLCSLSFILYIDRLCISKAAPQIEQELGMTHTAMGFV